MKTSALVPQALLTLIAVFACDAAMARTVHDAGLGAYGYECQHCRLEYGELMGLFGSLDEYDPAIRYNPETGEDLRNFAPDRKVDYKHMRLIMTIPDMNEASFSATQCLVFEPIAKPLETLRLNAMLMNIERVRVDPMTPAISATEVTHTHDGEFLDIRFEPPIPAGQRADLIIDYTVTDPVDGLFWIHESDEWPDRPAQIHTQGQPETNRFWFPAHDSPNERLTTELIVSAPEGYTVVSNGRLFDGTMSRPGHEGLKTWRWIQDKDHATYLVTLVVGKFDVVDVAPPNSDIPLPVYVPEGKGPLVQQTFANTARMLELFERRFGEPYPWDKYANLVVWNFGAGGMENTSATSLYDTAVLDSVALNDSDLDGLNSHELAHQWFGDLLTCKTWAHIWLNEGWATYSTSLWLEERDGYQNGYLRNLYGAMRGLADRDQLDPGSTATRPGMVSPIYAHPWEVFRRRSNPYPKGAATLHMLRSTLGEELFFEGVREYVDRYKFKTVETDDFRKVLEEVSGLSLEHFFTQWCERPGTPKVRISSSWNEPSRTLTVSVEQLQRIDSEHPAYRFDLPIEIYAAPGSRAPLSVTIPISERSHEYTIPLEAAPAMVVADPDLSVLMSVEIDQPTSWLRNQASHRSLASRLEATKLLRNHQSAETVRTLERIASDANEHWSVRQMAAESLGKLGALSALLNARSATADDEPGDRAKVTSAILKAIGDAWDRPASELRPIIEESLASREWSYEVAAVAMELAGQHGDESYLPLFEQALTCDSQHERIRRGALKGLADLDLPQGIELAEPYTRFGNLNRLRPEAISTIATLSHHDSQRAFGIIAPLLRDSETRTMRGAMDAIVSIGEPGGIRELELLVTRLQHPVHKEEARGALERLRQKTSD
ncbi:MAG: M1 family aminopeptidase [Phycisphaerales bacterium JB065]